MVLDNSCMIMTRRIIDWFNLAGSDVCSHVWPEIVNLQCLNFCRGIKSATLPLSDESNEPRAMVR